jgi:pyridoxal 5'-phosphate synthase pdxT subunit
VLVGVLALQGDFAAHARVLRSLGLGGAQVRTRSELAAVDALVVPGGESTTMLRLLEADGLGAALAARVAGGMPTLATCAGVILLARGVSPAQPSFGVLDLDVERNAYGRQLFSTVAEIAVAPEVGGQPVMEGVFIRAPRITRWGDRVTVLGRRGADPVLVRQGAIVAATFHPELTDDRRVHTLVAAIGGEHAW